MKFQRTFVLLSSIILIFLTILVIKLHNFTTTVEKQQKHSYAPLVSQPITYTLPSEPTNYTLRKNAIVIASEKVSAAVVNIQSTLQEENYGFDDNFFKFFFDLDPFPQYRKSISIGSGMIIEKAGYILTNQHLIENADEIEVTLIDGRKFKAALIGKCTEVDIALIKIEPKEDLPVAKLGNSDDILIGEEVIAIGNPAGLDHTVTSGIISALHRSLSSSTDEERVYEDMIQTDASINPGNSGGPLVNILGEVIGINSVIYRKSGEIGIEGIGFAIPINVAKKIAEDLIEYKEVIKPYIGIFPQEIKSNSLYTGIFIGDVIKNSPAEKAGLKKGDIIIKIGTKKINNLRKYRRALLELKIEKEAIFIILRNNQQKEIILIPQKTPSIGKGGLGIKVENNTQFLQRQYNLFEEEGVVVVKVFFDTSKTIQHGDVIRQINNQVVNDITSYEKALSNIKIGDTVLVFLIRGRVGFYITLIAK